MSTIRVTREAGGLTDLLRQYSVVINGRVIGKLDPSDTGVFRVDPGRHELYVKMTWARSEKLIVEIGDGEQAAFICAPRANPLTDLYWGTIGYRRYIRLQRVR